MTDIIRQLCQNAYVNRGKPMTALFYLEVAYAAASQAGKGRACNAIFKVIQQYKAILEMRP